MRTDLFVNNQPGGMFSMVDINKHPGNVWFADSGHAEKSNSDGYGQNPDAPFATIDYAIGKCTANNGDTIYVMPGHTETISSAAAIACDVAGISIIGLGAGNDRPKITIGTANTATITITAASVAFKNIIIIGALDGLDNALVITGDDCDVDIEYRDTSATVEANVAIQMTGVDRGKVKLNYIGFITGDACTNAIIVTGCTKCDIDVNFYGVASSCVVRFLTTASENVNITGIFYNSGTTDLSKNVIMTIAACTWTVRGFDGAAGRAFSGGSAEAIASDDVSAIIPAVDSYMLVQAGLDRSYMLVQAGLDRSYVLVEATADQSYMLVQDTLNRSHMLVGKDSGESYMKVQGDADRSYMIVMGDEDQSYMKVEADADMSYMLIQTTLDRSHMLVQGTADRSHMLVNAGIDQSYMKVEADAAMSYMLLEAGLNQSYMLVKATDQIAADTSYMLVQAGIIQSYMLVEATAQIVADTSYMLVQTQLDRSYMLVHGDLILSRIALLPST